MQLIVINGESCSEKIEVEIEEFAFVADIKDKFDEILSGHGKYKSEYFILIYKNMVLNDDYIKLYNFHDHDEIWFGKIENYLTNEDCIAEIFIAARTLDIIYIIVKLNDSISAIRLILAKVYSEITNLWDCKGREIKNNEIVKDIYTSGLFKIFASCGDLSFEDCCCQHDQFKCKSYLYNWSANIIQETTRAKVINRMNKIRKLLTSSNYEFNSRFNENLLNFPLSFVNSNILFRDVIGYYIWEICENFWKLIENPYNHFERIQLRLYCHASILVALSEYSVARQHHPENTDKSINDIIIDALDYFVTLLAYLDEDWKFTAKKLLFPCLLISYSSFEFDKFFDQCNSDKSFVMMRINCENKLLAIPSTPQTVIEAKRVIACKCGVSIDDFYCIDLYNSDKPNDWDTYEYELMFERMRNIENINITRELASGGFGRIFICQNKFSTNNFLIKKSINETENLHREIFINLQFFYSDKLFKISGLIRNENHPCLAMPYFPGGSLASYIEQIRCLDEKEIGNILYQILMQINELHRLGIIHRDIKPDNIVFDEKKNAKLIDFGLAKCMDEWKNKDQLENLKSYVPGTVKYMAPELVKGSPYSNKIDIWSFGMVIVEMVTGKPPFPGMAIGKILLELRKLETYRFKSIKQISNDMKLLIGSCLKANPELRQTGQQMIKSQLFINSFGRFNRC